MNRSMLAIFAGILVVSAQAFAQTPSATKQPAADPLSAIAWLTGGTWFSDIKDSSDGSVTHVEERIRWSPNHQAIQFNVEFNGKPHYDGFYAFNPATGKIGFYYTSSEGELTIGNATPDEDGKTLHQDFDIMHTNGNTGHVRSTLARDGENAYWFSVLMQKNGEWQQVFKIRYERKPQ